MSRATRPLPAPAYYTVSDLQARLKVSRATIYRWVDSGYLPAPVQLAARSPRWPVALISTWEERLLRDRPGAAPAPEGEQ